MNENDQIISRYTRAQAIEDGVLVDVTEQAKETGLLLPTVITDHVHTYWKTFHKRAWVRIIVAGFTMFSGWRTSNCRDSNAKASERATSLIGSRSLSTVGHIHCELMPMVMASPSCTRKITHSPCHHDADLARAFRFLYQS
jgi:hypothetical protein